MNPRPYESPELFDSIILAGVRSPGKVTISGYGRVIGWDVKKAAGQKGATTTRTSEAPREFTCSFYLSDDPTVDVDQDDLVTWESFQKLIESSVDEKKPKALDIYHPDLASRKIKSVVLANLGDVVHDGKGGQTIAVKFLEYMPPKPATGTPTGSKSKAKADPNADAKAELARVLAEYQRTPWG